MSESKFRSVEPFAERVFKIIERMIVIAVLAFAAAHLEGPAELAGAAIVASLFLLAVLSAIEPLLERAFWRDHTVTFRLLRVAGFLVLAFGAVLIFVFGFRMVLPFSG